MGKFGTHAEADDVKLHSMVIILPINGNRVITIRNIMSDVLSTFRTVRVLDELVHRDDDHVELTVVSEDDICIDFYKGLRDRLQTTSIPNLRCPPADVFEIPVSVLPVKERARSVVEMISLHDVVHGQVNEFNDPIEHFEQCPSTINDYVPSPQRAIKKLGKHGMEDTRSEIPVVKENNATLNLYQFSMDITAVSDHLNIKHWTYLGREYNNIICEIHKNKNSTILHCETSIKNKEYAEMFEEVIQNILNDRSNVMEDIERQKTKKIHIFVDVSNIKIGIQRLNNGTSNFSIRINVKKLVDLITNLRKIESAYAVGSDLENESIAKKKPFWKVWESCGFETTIKRRVGVGVAKGGGNNGTSSISSGGGGGGEQTVDEALHALIAVEANKKYRESRTLVILTGDGNDNHNHGTNFPFVIRQALAGDWNVELWSWSHCVNEIYTSEEFRVFYASR
eukprot:gene12950-27323_t